jgi:hypothetical protein
MRLTQACENFTIESLERVEGQIRRLHLGPIALTWFRHQDALHARGLRRLQSSYGIFQSEALLSGESEKIHRRAVHGRIRLAAKLLLGRVNDLEELPDPECLERWLDDPARR